MRMNRIREPLTKYHFRKIIVIVCFRIVFSMQVFQHNVEVTREIYISPYYYTLIIAHGTVS